MYKFNSTFNFEINIPSHFHLSFHKNMEIETSNPLAAFDDKIEIFESLYGISLEREHYRDVLHGVLARRLERDLFETFKDVPTKDLVEIVAHVDMNLDKEKSGNENHFEA